MFARRKLKTRGSIVLYYAVPENTVDYMRSLSRDDQTFWIHESWDGAIHDNFRFRAFVPDTLARELALYIKRFYKTFFTDGFTTEWRFLKTAGSAEDQLIRREFTSGEEPMNACSVPGSLLVATQDNTYFYGYGWNRQVPLRSDQQIIELNKGDIVQFRGDYLFGGAGSAANNVCIHAYLDTLHHPRLEYHIPEFVAVRDNTRDIDDVFCYVWNCPYIDSSLKALLKHLNNFHGFFFNHPPHTAP